MLIHNELSTEAADWTDHPKKPMKSSFPTPLKATLKVAMQHFIAKTIF